MRTRKLSEIIFSSRLWTYVFIISLGVIICVASAVIFGLGDKELIGDIASSIIASPVLAELILFIKRREKQLDVKNSKKESN